jgi:membrane-associated phospholipid phosphatase
VLFWDGYFRLEHIAHPSVTQMPALAVDRMIPFTPGAAFIYVSQFVTMPLVIWLMTSRRQLLRCCSGLLLLIGVSFLVFYCWPTAVARPEVVPGRFFIYDLVVGADQNRNACPSLHAAFGVFTAGCAWEVFQGWKHSRWLIGMSWVWTAAILASTLLIKQHVFLDLLAGSLLGIMSWWFVGKISRRTTAPKNENGSTPVSPASSGFES